MNAIPVAEAQSLRQFAEQHRMIPAHRASEWRQWCAQLDRMAQQQAEQADLGLPLLLLVPLWGVALGITGTVGWWSWKAAKRGGELIDQSAEGAATVGGAVASLLPVLLIVWLLTRKNK